MNKMASVFAVGKTVVSGEKIEFKNYSVPVCCEAREHSVERKHTVEDGEKRIDNLSRARMQVRQRVWANIEPHSKFLTLTTADTVLDEKTFKRRMTTFFQAMKRDGFELRYLYVLERQKKRGEKEGNSGSIHAHIIIFNDEYIPMKVIKSHWNGRTEIKMLDGLREGNGEKVRDAGAYICKYVTKESNLEWGSRCFNCSVGLKKPIVIPLTIYGDNNGNYYPKENEDTANRIIDFLQSSSDVVYANSKVIQYDVGDGIVNQIIDYKQANFSSVIGDDSNK